MDQNTARGPPVRTPNAGLPAEPESDAQSPRTIRLLEHHVFNIVDSHIECLATGAKSLSDLTNREAQDGTFTTAGQMADYGEQAITRIEQWWSGLTDNSLRQPSPATDYGPAFTMHQMPELSVWHSTQHTRQVAAVLERLGIEPDGKLTQDELAGLPLPMYLTTNYDDFMIKALVSRFKDPRREYCRWNELIREDETLFDREANYSPSVANPLVYHLHGHTRAESIVLTEDDYLTFLAEMQTPDLLPKPVRAGIAKSSLVFLGYRMADWNVRVLFQGLRALGRGLAGRGSLSVIVLVPPTGPEEAREKEQKYLDNYYAAMDLRVYWGTARDFCGELAQRWKQHPDAR